MEPAPIFTPRSARRALPQIRPAAERMCRIFRAMERRRPAGGGPEQPVDPAYFGLVRRLHGALLQIHRLGARVRDPRSGMLDFPARREGRVVALCWKVGEPTVGFWHERGAGLEERRPLQDDGRWEEA